MAKAYDEVILSNAIPGAEGRCTHGTALKDHCGACIDSGNKISRKIQHTTEAPPHNRRVVLAALEDHLETLEENLVASTNFEIDYSDLDDLVAQSKRAIQQMEAAIKNVDELRQEIERWK